MTRFSSENHVSGHLSLLLLLLLLLVLEQVKEVKKLRKEVELLSKPHKLWLRQIEKLPPPKKEKSHGGKR